jgi:hypothetical protein
MRTLQTGRPVVIGYVCHPKAAQGLESPRRGCFGHSAARNPCGSAAFASGLLHERPRDDQQKRCQAAVALGHRRNSDQVQQTGRLVLTLGPENEGSGPDCGVGGAGGSGGERRLTYLVWTPLAPVHIYMSSTQLLTFLICA